MAHEASPVTNSRPPAAEAEGPSRPAFLRLLFSLLDQYAVRYCVLHSYEGLPQDLPSDLDLAVHPHDVAKLPPLFRSLEEKGYRPVQCVNYAVKGYCFDFVWFEGASLNCAPVDATYEYREGGLILIPGEELVAGRRKRGSFWAPDPKVELAYLMAKKTLKGSVPAHQEKRLGLLVREVGSSEAERVAGNLFGERLEKRVVEACTRGCAGGVLGRLRRRLWWSIAKRNALNPIRCLLADAPRLTRRWFQPTGLLLVVLGPDGVGKSTLIARLTQVLLPPFRRWIVFHWRPLLVWRRRHSGPISDPHAKPPRSPVASIAKLFALLPDYWFGYWLVTRPLLARSGLVVFDRYFHDLLVDPLRYRDGAPMWLSRFLSMFVTPAESLFLILDAPDEVILSRKHEVPPEELRRQRAAYKRLGDELPNAVCVCNDQDIDHTVGVASRTVIEHLARRFQRRHASWLASGEEQAAEGGEPSRGWVKS